MRTHAKGLLGAALLIIAVAFMLSMSCSWRIFSEGEIQKETAELEESLKPCPLPIVEIIRRFSSGTDDPDSVEFRVFSWIDYEGGTAGFVEMEVGELIDGGDSGPDTLVVNHRP